MRTRQSDSEQSGEKKKPLLSRKQFFLFLLIPFFASVVIGFLESINYGKKYYFELRMFFIFEFLTFFPVLFLIWIFSGFKHKVFRIIKLCLIYCLLFYVFSMGAMIAANRYSKMLFRGELARGERIAVHLEEYKEQTGSYPENLEFLKENYKSDFSEKGLLSYRYFEEDSRYELTCWDPFDSTPFYSYLFDTETGKWQRVYLSDPETGEWQRIGN